MSKYFIKLDDADQKGPYTIEELKTMDLTDDYSIWTEGFSNWRNIKVMNELKEYILKLPPSINKNDIKISKLDKTNQRIALWVTFGAGLFLFYLFGGFEDKYDLLDNYPGLASSSLGDEAAIKVRGILLVFALLISGAIGLLIYFQQMMVVYKKSYKKIDI